MNEYTEKYKTFDNHKLLKILAEAEKYRPEAIEAAKIEITSRNISASEEESFNEALEAEQALNASKQKRITEVENKAKSIGAEFFKTISPIQAEVQTVDRKINLLAFLFALVSLYIVYQDFGFFLFMLTDLLTEWDFEMFLYFLPFLLLLPATILFWLRKSVGWIVWCSCSVYALLNLIFSFYLTLDNSAYDHENISGSVYLDYTDNSGIFPETHPLLYISAIGMLGAILWVMNRADIGEAFQLSEHTAEKTIGFASAIALFILYYNSL